MCSSQSLMLCEAEPARQRICWPPHTHPLTPIDDPHQSFALGLDRSPVWLFPSTSAGPSSDLVCECRCSFRQTQSQHHQLRSHCERSFDLQVPPSAPQPPPSSQHHSENAVNGSHVSTPAAVVCAPAPPVATAMTPAAAAPATPAAAVHKPSLAAQAIECWSASKRASLNFFMQSMGGGVASATNHNSNTVLNGDPQAPVTTATPAATGHSFPTNAAITSLAPPLQQPGTGMSVLENHRNIIAQRPYRGLRELLRSGPSGSGATAIRPLDRSALSGASEHQGTAGGRAGREPQPGSAAAALDWYGNGAATAGQRPGRYAPYALQAPSRPDSRWVKGCVSVHVVCSYLV